ncbi:MAG: DUF1800 domain-containing protein [Planctomycetota bacterium]|jgi:uncharacterized protein (DUF1800 family)
MPPTPGDPLRPLPPEAFDYWKAQHLLNRAGFGGTPAQVRALANMGVRKAVDYIVDYHEVDGAAVVATRFDPDIMRPASPDERRQIRRARQSGDEAAVEQFRRERQRRQQADRRQMREIQRWWLTRMIETPRPLEEKLTLFWHGHFATSYRTIEDSWHMLRQNELFRANAADSFADLVYGIVRDPAMLRYLNNNQNRRQQPNENLARELMELFTLGEGNAYTEDDIKEGARALTGYTYDDDEFVFRRQAHDDGVKRVLGRRGRWDGTDFCRIILEQPVVSEFISLKLYRFLVNDLPGEPDEAAQRVVLRVARRLRKQNYALRPVLRALFRSEHFYDPANVGAQIKSPIQLIVQTIRSLRTPVRSLDTLLSAAEHMGQNIFFPPNVKGWDVGRTWINTSTLFVRQNIVIHLLTGHRPRAYPWEGDGEPYDAMHLVEHLRGEDGRYEVEPTVVYLLRFTLGREPHAERVRTLVDFVQDRGGRIHNDVLVALLALIAAMPEYQLC